MDFLAIADHATRLQDKFQAIYDYLRERVARQHADYTLASQTAAQPLFNVAAAGRIRLPVGVYTVDGLVHITGMSATSGNAQLDLLGGGGATLAAQLIQLVGIDAAANAANAGQITTILGQNTSPASAVAAATNTELTLKIDGTFEVTVEGTVIPSIALVTAAAAVVKAGSYIRFRRLGDVTLTGIGEWQ